MVVSRTGLVTATMLDLSHWICCETVHILRVPDCQSLLKNISDARIGLQLIAAEFDDADRVTGTMDV
jgi:hypothetical protein